MGNELPAGLSAPAIRALASIGVFDLQSVARFTEAEISGLHGMGLKGKRILKEALARFGAPFKA